MRRHYVVLKSDEDDCVFVEQLSAGQSVRGLLNLVFSAHAESHFNKVPFDASKVKKIIEQAVSSPENKVIYVARDRSKIFGGVYCSIGEYFMGKDYLLCTVNAFYISRHYRTTLIGGKVALELLHMAKSWAKTKGAKEVLVHNTSDISSSRSGMFFEKAGFSEIGSNFSLGLSCEKT